MDAGATGVDAPGARERTASTDGGRATVEAVALAAVLVAVLAGLATAATPIGERFGDAVRTLLCRATAIVTGEACAAPSQGPSLAGEPVPCVKKEVARSVEASVRVAFVDVGAGEGYLREEHSDGTVHITWIQDGSVSGTAGAGARGGITIGEGDYRGGAWISGELGVGGSRGQTWVFHDPGDADDFVRARRNQAIRDAVGSVVPPVSIINGIVDAVRGPRFPSPDIEYFEAGPQGSVGGGAGYGPGRVEGGAEGSAVVGGKRDHRTGETTLYFKIDGQSSGGGGVVLNTSGAKGWTGVGELVLDKNGRPTTFRITETVQTERGGMLAGEYLSLDDLGERLGNAAVDLTSAGTHSTSIVSGLDLTDPDNYAAALDLFRAAATSALPGGAQRARDAAAAYRARVLDNGLLTAVEREGSTWGLGGGAEVALGPKLGFDLGYDSSESTPVDAWYLDPASGGRRSLVAWEACLGG